MIPGYLRARWRDRPSQEQAEDYSKPAASLSDRRRWAQHASLLRCGLLLVSLLLTCFALPHRTQAVVPAPDGGYPGGNTAERQTALLSLTTGGFNTAVGYLSLRNNTTNSFNTAIGAGALLANTADENTATGIKLTGARNLSVRSSCIVDLAPASSLPRISARLKKIQAASQG